MTAAATNHGIPVTMTDPYSSFKKISSTQTSATEQKDMFLKLMVAQMKNQDPSSPMDQKEMLGQMAQFTSVEQLTNMTTAMASLQANSTFSQSVSMIGKTVDYLDANGNSVTVCPVTELPFASR